MSMMRCDRTKTAVAEKIGWYKRSDFKVYSDALLDEVIEQVSAVLEGWDIEDTGNAAFGYTPSMWSHEREATEYLYNVLDWVYEQKLEDATETEPIGWRSGSSHTIAAR